MILDTKLPIYLLPYLSHQDLHIKQLLLEVFWEISVGFDSPNEFSYLAGRNENRLIHMGSHDVNKTLGIISHINISNDDRLDKNRFIQISNDYYFLNK